MADLPLGLILTDSDIDLSRCGCVEPDFFGDFQIVIVSAAATDCVPDRRHLTYTCCFVSFSVLLAFIFGCFVLAVTI